MKQVSVYITAIVVILAVLIAIYFFGNLLKPEDTSYSLYTAVEYQIGDGISTSGYIARDETPITGHGKIVVLTRSEGEKIGKNQTIARSYDSDDAQDIQNRIDELENSLSQLQYAYTFTGSGSESLGMDESITKTIGQVAIYANRRDFAFASGSAAQLKSYILRRFASAEDSGTLRDRIRNLETEIATLRAKAGNATGEIKAMYSGWFSGTVDGYEAVLTGETVQSMSVRSFEALPDGQRNVPDSTIGKIITGTDWYYITVVDADAVSDYSSGDRITVQFAHDFYDTFRMKIVRIGEVEDGKRILVLSCGNYLEQAAGLREESANLIFSYKKGLRVPKEAIYVVNGKCGVYVLEGVEAEWKTVDILYYGEESIIVRLDRSSTDNLWPEDQIILTDGEIFDGKVIQSE